MQKAAEFETVQVLSLARTTALVKLYQDDSYDTTLQMTWIHPSIQRMLQT